jgi:hypothetical protein
MRVCPLLAALVTCWGCASQAQDFPAAFAPVVQASQAREQAAHQRLAEVRAERDALARELAQADLALRRISLPERPAEAVAAAAAALAQGWARVKEAEAAAQTAPPPEGTLAGFLVRDRLADALTAAQAALPDLVRAEQQAWLAAARPQAGGAEWADRFEDLRARHLAAEHEVSVAQAARDAISRAEKGLRGLLLAPGPTAREAPALVVTPEPPADAARRREIFAQRASPAAIAASAREFFAGLDLDFPGLEPVRAHLAADRPAEALQAYQRFFFAGLLAQEEPSAGGGGEDDEGVAGDATNSRAVFAPPTEAALADALAGRITQNIGIQGKTLAVSVTLGEPGAMPWGFLSPERAAHAADGAHLLQFSRNLAESGRVGIALLHSYALGGPVEHLHRWAAMLDDWTLNWRRDAEATPLPLRDYNLLAVYRLNEARALLRNVALLRPSLVDDLPAATLARWLSAMQEEYLASAIRLGRSGLYNFRIMALGGMIPVSLRMQEFHVQRWALREAWRQVDNNFIYKIRRDGANFEFANDGHENTDQALLRPFRMLKVWNAQPAWTEPFWAEEYLDNFLSNSRYWVHNLKPDGFSYRLNARTQRMRYAGHQPEYKVNLLAHEEEVRRRLWKVFGIGRPEPDPAVHSESMAFQGYSYLRSGWEPESRFLYFQSIGQPILSGREDNTGFSLYGDGGIHLLTPAPAVDGRVQRLHRDLIHWPGGKAPYASYGRPEAVRPGRFVAGADFDLVEGEFRGPYDFHVGDTFVDVFGSYGLEVEGARAKSRAEKAGEPFPPPPVLDVRQSRRVLALRGRDLYLVIDHFHSERAHRFTQFHTVYTPVRLDGLRERLVALAAAGVEPVQLDAQARRLTTHNPGLPGLTLRHLSGFPVDYRLKEDARWVAARAGEIGVPELFKRLSKRDRQHSEQWAAAQFGRPVAVEWTGQGDQLLLTCLEPRGRDYGLTVPEGLGDFRPDPAATPDRTGFTARFPDGTPLAVAASVHPADLRAPGLQATASLLVVDGERGVLLDCARLSDAAGPRTPTHPDFTFRLRDGRVEEIEPIHRRIAPVVIHPETNVFVGEQTVTLACATPGVEIRYTLDGSRPTPASPRYAEPIVLRATTRLQARAFRSGVHEDVWAQDGTHATVVSSAVFRREAPRVADPGPRQPGLRVAYAEGVWTHLMAQGPRVPPQATGVAPRLFDLTLRRTDGPHTLRYEGWLEVPTDGVYTFHAPREFLFPDQESGYDLRVSVGGQKWNPAVRWHGHGTWSIALQRGAHPFQVVFTDLRFRPHKIELMWGFPHPEFTWSGQTPDLRVSGPGLPPQPIPEAWLRH